MYLQLKDHFVEEPCEKASGDSCFQHGVLCEKLQQFVKSKPNESCLCLVAVKPQRNIFSGKGRRIRNTYKSLPPTITFMRRIWLLLVKADIPVFSAIYCSQFNTHLMLFISECWKKTNPITKHANRKFPS